MNIKILSYKPHIVSGIWPALVFLICIIPTMAVSGPLEGKTVDPKNELLNPGQSELKGSLTLTQAMSLSLMHNPELEVFSMELRALDASAVQAGLIPNPELEIEVEDFGGTGDFKQDQVSETTIQLSQTIELGGKREKRKKTAAIARDMGEWDYKAKRADVLRDVKKAFIDVLASQERFDLNMELVQISEQILETVKERVKVGRESPVKETRARAAFSKAQIKLSRSRGLLDSSSRRLAMFWADTNPGFKRVVGRMDRIFPVPSSEQLKGMISQNPDIARWTVETAYRQSDMSLAKAESIPDLAINMGVKYHNETDDTAFVFGVSIPIPLFDRNQGEILEKRYGLEAAKKKSELKRLSVVNQLAQSHQYLLSAQSEVDALKNDVLPNVQSTFEAIAEGYRLGKFGYLVILDSQQALFETREQTIDALHRYHLSLIEIERLTGTVFDSLAAENHSKFEYGG